MIALESAPKVAAAPARPVPTWEQVFNGLRAIVRAFFNRRHLTELNDMTDTQLEDLGLNREDLREAMNMPLHVDPTTQLGRLAHERAQIMSAARHVC